MAYYKELGVSAEAENPELVSGTESDAASGYADRGEIVKVRRADYDLKLVPLGFVGSGAVDSVLTW